MFDEHYFFTMNHLTTFIGEYTVVILNLINQIASR